MSGGSFELRQPGFLNSNILSVKTGEFFTGDQIQIVERSGAAPVDVSGFFIPDEAGMLVHAASPLGRNVIRVDRLGTEPSRISSNVVDRSLTDPFLLFVSLIPAVVLTVLQLFSSFVPGRKP